MEHIINALHGVVQRAAVTHVTDVELDLPRHLRHPRLEVVAHVVLFLLVTGEYSDLSDVRPQEAVQHRIPETSSTSRNQQRLVFKNTHGQLFILLSHS